MKKSNGRAHKIKEQSKSESPTMTEGTYKDRKDTRDERKYGKTRLVINKRTKFNREEESHKQSRSA